MIKILNQIPALPDHILNRIRWEYPLRDNGHLYPPPPLCLPRLRVSQRVLITGHTSVNPVSLSVHPHYDVTDKQTTFSHTHERPGGGHDFFRGWGQRRGHLQFLLIVLGKKKVAQLYIQSDFVNPCFFNSYASQSEHTHLFCHFLFKNDSVIRMFHNPNTF